MVVCTVKSKLAESCRQLVELMQSINFGRIEQLLVCNGEPVLNPPPRILREIKFCSENGSRPELSMADFLLKTQIVQLFAYLDELQNGTIAMLEIKYGLPFRMVVEDIVA